MNKKNIFGNYLVNVVNLVLPIATLPVLTRILDKKSFGEYSIFLVWLVFASVIVDFGMSSFGTREISSGVHETSQWFWSSLLVRAFLAVVLSVIIAFGVLRPFQMNAILVMAFAIACSSYITQIFWASNGLQNTHIITPIFLISKILSTLLSILIAFLTKDLSITLLAFSFSLLIPSTLSFYHFIKATAIKLPEKQSFGLVRKIVSLGWSISLVNLAGILFNGSLILVTQWYFGTSEAAGISIADRVSRAILGLAAPFTVSMLPFVTQGFAIGRDEGVRRIVDKGKWLLTAYCFVGSLVIILARRILSIFGPQFEDYSLQLQLLTVWGFFSLTNNLIGIQYFIGSGASKTYSAIFFMSCFLLILLYTFMPKLLSLNGVVLSILFGEASFTVFSMSWILVKWKRR
ncbi:oligosaccharide flippase family protein [Deinococcus sp.]|uniref:oligosaccharide flippase family protein n=1 Tax=Deinococcus sp. TaxID=47478 RepID=UPI0025F6E17E|nr:oligosaccharide flippase family protein [Deinococcus sp.]